MRKVYLLLCALPLCASAQEPTTQAPKTLRAAIYAGSTFGGVTTGHFYNETEESTTPYDDSRDGASLLVGAEITKAFGVIDLGVNVEFSRYGSDGDSLFNLMALGRYRIGNFWLGSAAGLHLMTFGSGTARVGGLEFPYDPPDTAFVVSPRIGYDFGQFGVQLAYSALSDSARAEKTHVGIVHNVYSRSYWSLSLRFAP